MTAQATIQLWVVPRVETRKRREDRWERDVRALGELLTAELPDFASDARHQQWRLQFMCDSAARRGLDDERRADFLREPSTAAEESAKRYDAVTTRLQWLVDRIVGIAPANDELSRFEFKAMAYRTAAFGCTLYTYPVDEFDDAEFKERWDDERKRRSLLIAAVETLMRGRPLRGPSNLQRVKRRVVERRKAWRDKKISESHSAGQAVGPESN